MAHILLVVHLSCHHQGSKNHAQGWHISCMGGKGHTNWDGTDGALMQRLCPGASRLAPLRYARKHINLVTCTYVAE